MRLLLLAALGPALALAEVQWQDAEQPPPAFDYAQAARLERPARREKIAGAALMGLGTALAFAGQVLLFKNYVGLGGCSDARPAPSGGSCWYVPSQAYGGIAALSLGVASLYSGIALYAVGGAQMRKARQLRGLELSSGFGRSGSAR